MIYLLISPIGLPQFFTYFIKKENFKIMNPEIGDIVQIEIKKRKTWGIIAEISNKKPYFETKEISKLIKLNENYKFFLNTISNRYLLENNVLKKRVLKLLNSFSKNLKIKKEDIIEIKNENIKLELNNEQVQIFNKIKNLINEIDYKFKPILIYGKTGSGKTILYKFLIEEILKKGKSVVCILPDITLADNIKNEFEKYIKNEKIFSYHANTSKKDKIDVWNLITENKPFLLVGVHLPIFLPINNIGLYLIDEEHDSGFQEKNFPFINSKEAALIKAKIENIPIIMGSATPSINSIHLCKNKKYELFEIKNRFNNIKLPNVNHIILKKDNIYKNNFWLSNELFEEMNRILNEKKQVLLFLNKKGLYFFAQCSFCNFIFKCINCSCVYTVYEHNLLKCNRCESKKTFQEDCPSCKKTKTINTKGIGIAYIRKKIEEFFPNKKIEQIDLENFKNKKLLNEKIKEIKYEDIDIIIGTNLISRGYHFPKVKLVGLIWADMQLNIPNYLSLEQTIQRVIQVSGRSGREENGDVIIQTLSENTAFNFLSENNYNNFYEYEIKFRKEFEYPPFIKISLILFQSKNKIKLKEISNNFYKKLNLINDLKVFEPKEAPIYKVKNIYTEYIYLKIYSNNIEIEINKIKNEFEFYLKNENITFSYIPNPINTNYN